jgi:4Fe-4S ferredoxin
VTGVVSIQGAETGASIADQPRTANCKAGPGVFRPVVDPRRCEGKSACAAVCPYTVFEVGRMADETFSALPLRFKLKVWAHGKKTAYTPNADACRACGLCVAACPERAISLVRAAS